jgi:hypothetical protein
MTSRTDCIYCHAPFTKENPATRERKDSKLGYDAEGNVVLACLRCNVMKNEFITFEEMLIVGPIIAELVASRDLYHLLYMTATQHVLRPGYGAFVRGTPPHGACNRARRRPRAPCRLAVIDPIAETSLGTGDHYAGFLWNLCRPFADRLYSHLWARRSYDSN